MIWLTSDTHFGHGNIIKYTERMFAMNQAERDLIAVLKSAACTGDQYDRYRAMRLSRDSVEKHDAILIQNWNKCIQTDDDVYHLGDFAWGQPQDWHGILDQLNGRIHLIFGNHDKKFQHRDDYRSVRERFASLHMAYELIVPDNDAHNGNQLVYLHHYSCRVWNKSHHGSFHAWGHSHSSMQERYGGEFGRSMDVGMDNIAKTLREEAGIHFWGETGQPDRIDEVATMYRPIGYKEFKVRMLSKQMHVVDHHKKR